MSKINCAFYLSQISDNNEVESIAYIQLILPEYLALAKDSKADYLIKGDLDLLVLKQFEQTQITTYKEFYLKISENN